MAHVTYYRYNQWALVTKRVVSTVEEEVTGKSSAECVFVVHCYIAKAI